MTELRRRTLVDRGLAALSHGGPDALDRALSADADVAALFGSWDGFLVALAEAWTVRHTIEPLGTSDPAALSEAEQVAIEERVATLDFRLEIAIRDLARRSGGVALVLKRTDALRLRYIAAGYVARFDLPAEEARDLAALDYALLLGTALVEPDLTPDRVLRVSETLDRVLQRAYRPATAWADPRQGSGRT